MNEVSIILRNNIILTVEEFRILNYYAYPGRFWSLIQRSQQPPFTIRSKTVEYILDPETLTFFGIISTNILVSWDTAITKNIRIDEEFQLMDTVFIKPYEK